MSSNPSNEFFRQKITLLKQCLALSEELISSIENWETLPDLLSRREAVIQELKALEDGAGSEASASLSGEMQREIRQTVNLILDLDRDAEALIRKEQQNTMDSMKANIKEQKFIQYIPSAEPKPGSRLDYKK